MSFIYRQNSVAPLDYETPPFPSLYWPFPIRGPQSYYLYHAGDVWRFTFTWTLICFGAVHLATAGYAVVVQWRNWRVIWIVPLLYAIIGGIEAIIAGSIVGGLLGGVYNSGYFSMSTWIPFVWALISTFVLILSSFAIQGGL
ncbi:uncharacterized protein K452DRAFT_153465 [Aplosporella prunicola CBS 121167]|uniref:Integral membrane protein n=1 Tax=Aplosporella prunicola CBS 121167 TaxID=1176127 RepID=A0A6A6BMS6_9PEZI|nr:uncharacterized protein K452DRAFT_153465 [Aplosporella prunicola CBS 121167]KAF2144127.1 hypothetical protein K452DRAFT_153465 [Aplosporella prunicola CBS 121167]